MPISQADTNQLRQLEQSLWDAKTRFDQAYMEKILAPDFFEFGRSGRIYKRQETLAVPADATIQSTLKDFKVHAITETVTKI